jgi:hypothetical protein
VHEPCRTQERNSAVDELWEGGCKGRRDTTTLVRIISVIDDEEGEEWMYHGDAGDARGRPTNVLHDERGLGGVEWRGVWSVGRVSIPPSVQILRDAETQYSVTTLPERQHASLRTERKDAVSPIRETASDFVPNHARHEKPMNEHDLSGPHLIMSTGLPFRRTNDIRASHPPAQSASSARARLVDPHMRLRDRSRVGTRASAVRSVGAPRASARPYRAAATES